MERNRIKILIIAPQPFFSIRGTPLAVRELTGVLLRSGHAVDILTFHLGEDLKEKDLKIYRNKIFSKSIKSISPGFAFRKLILDFVLIPKAIRLIFRNKYDIVHCVEESAFFIPFIKWIKPFLFTYDMDSDIPKQLVESGKIKNWFIIRLIKELEKIAIRSADCVVTMCPVFTDKIKKLFSGKKVFQIEDISVCDEMPNIKRNDHEKRILYTGNFEKYQGVEILLEAFENIKADWPQAFLVIAGGEDGEVNNFKRRYKDERIVFTGKRKFEEMPGIIASADILASPRIKGENTPFKIYSYLAGGKPILATNIISHTQILHNGEDSLLVDPTVEGLAGGITKLLSDNDFCGKIGSGARKLFKEKYTKDCFEKKARNYVNYMEGLCKKK